MSDTQAAGGVVIEFQIDTSKSAGQVQRMLNNLKKIDQASKATGKTFQETGLHLVSSQQASAAALRLTEGGLTNNLRAAEKFLSVLPGVGKALQAAFPAVGALAFVGVVARATTEVYKFIEASKQMPNKLASGFSSLTDSLEQSNDELSVTKDRLDKSIAILEKRPFNGMALALDESKVAADKLYGSLEKDRAKMAELMHDYGTNGISGFFARNFEGQGDTRNLEASTNKDFANISDLTLKYKQALHVNDTAGAASLTKQIHDAEQAAYTKAQNDIAMRQGNVPVWLAGSKEMVSYSSLHGDQTSNIKTDKAIESMMLERMNQSDLESGIDAATKRQASDESKNKQAELAKAAAARAAESQRKFDRQADQFASTAREPSRRSEYTRRYYSDNHLQQPAKELITPQQVFDAQNAIKQMFGNPKSSPQYQSEKDKIDMRGRELNTSEKYDYIKALIEDQQKTGLISPHQAALANASNSAQDYKEQSEIFTDQLKKINDIVNSRLTEDQKALKTKEVLNAQAELDGKRQLQVLKEQTEAMATTVRGGVAAGGTDYLSQFTPSNIASNLTGDTFSTVNSSLVSGMTTGHMHAASMFRGLSKDIGTQALGGIEKKAFGGMFSKIGASASNPIFARIVGGGLNPISAIGGNAQKAFKAMPTSISSLKTLLTPSGSTDNIATAIANTSAQSSNSIGGIVHKLFSFGTKMLPMMGFANGGAVSSGMPILVGERGPEIFTPGVSGGYITPNHQIARTNGGDTYNVDARGATDPAATAVATQNAIAHSSRATAKHTMKAMAEHRASRPAGR